MAVAFLPGTVLGQGDLDIFLTNSSSIATNAYEITYAIFWISTVFPYPEVLIGSPNRIPLNPNVGEYYASLQVPTNASIGTYHIRWNFKQFAGSPLQQVVQEWAVVSPGTTTAPTYSPCVTSMIGKLRMLLRDQCLGGETEIEVEADGERIIVRLDELHELLCSPSCLPARQ